jgi:hypothetical protein
MQKYFYLLFFSLICFAVNAQVATPDSTQSTTLRPTAAADSTDEDDNEMPSTDEREKLPEWYYTIALDGVYNTGNVNRELVALRLSLNHERAKSIWGFYTSPKFQYGRNNDLLQERELFFDLNNTFFYSQSDVYGLLFGSAEQSNLRKINSRWIGGVGVGYKISGGKRNPKARLKVSISNALLKEITDFYTREDRNVWRNSTRIKIKADIIKDKLSFSNTTFIQPSLSSSYLRWNAFSQLILKVGKHISFTAALENSFENINVEGVKNTQVNATVGLVFSQAN